MTFKEYIQDKPLVLVDFFAEWCGPCKMMTPVIQSLKVKVGDQAHIIKIDVDKNPSVMKEYNISGVPTFILFKFGKIVWQQAGAVSEQFLLDKIKSTQN